MRKLGFSIFLALLGVVAIGCDSGSDDDDNGVSDAEVFVGDWTLTNLLLNGQDFTSLLLASATVDIDFETAAFSLTITSDSTTTIAGTYSVNEAQKTITLSSTSFANPVTVSYVITSNNQISMETDDVALFSGLTGINPDDIGIVVETIGLVVQRTG